MNLLFQNDSKIIRQLISDYYFSIPNISAAEASNLNDDCIPDFKIAGAICAPGTENLQKVCT